jgi:hypothetical protein
MTESSRYLTNQLWRQRLNPGKVDAIDAVTGYKYVNAKNGMKEKLLNKMALVLANDFHEYNARPYARLTAKALENLYDFAEDLEIRRGRLSDQRAGGRIVRIERQTSRTGNPVSSARRAVPYRRLTDSEDKTALYDENADEETYRFLQLLGADDVLTKDLGGQLQGLTSNAFVVTSTSGYRVPDLIEDLIIKPDDRGEYFQRFRHEGYELMSAHRCS